MLSPIEVKIDEVRLKPSFWLTGENFLKIFTRDNSRFSVWFYHPKIEVITDGETMKILMPVTIADHGCGICKISDQAKYNPDQNEALGSFWMVSDLIDLGNEEACPLSKIEALKQVPNLTKEI